MKSTKLKMSLLGTMINEVQTKRALARTRALSELYKRNKITPGAAGYKIAESTVVKPSGREVTEYRLYKLIDAAVVTVGAEAKIEVEEGRESVAEGKPR